jgi:hypothetical protein
MFVVLIIIDSNWLLLMNEHLGIVPVIGVTVSHEALLELE